MSTPPNPPTPPSGERVCAVVVTFNRRELLRECLQALLTQTRPVETILVVNNVSTDGTGEMLAAEFPPARFPQVRVLDLPKNVGGAGGFHEGMKHGAAAGEDWLWLMDDDTIAPPGALAALLDARLSFPANNRPDVLASKVVWTDGSLHPMNTTWFKSYDYERTILAGERATLSVRTATFVSVLIHRRCVEVHGLPVSDYFIWGDDVEYTGRILRDGLGVLVPASVVVHKTPRKHGTLDPSPRFYYHVRNSVWSLAHSPAWKRGERLRLSIGFLRSVAAYLRAARYNRMSLGAVSRGFRDGFLRRPAK